MKRVAKKIKMFLSNDSKRTEYILKGITFVTSAISLTLILVMVLTSQSGETKTPPGEVNISNSLDSNIDKNADKGSEDQTYQHPSGKNDGSNENIDNSDSSTITAPHEESPSPKSSEPLSLTLSLTDAEASDLLSLAFSERFSITDVKVSFHSPDTVKVQGNMEKEKLGELFLEQDLPLLRAALILAPEVLEGELVFGLSLDDGILTATPERISVNRINLTRFVPPGAVESANEALRSLMPEQASIHSLKIEDGLITFTLHA